MTITGLPRRGLRAWTAAALVAGVSFLGACGALDVSDPTAVEDEELNNAGGADLLRVDALKRLHIIFGQTTRMVGVMTDELFADPPAWQPTESSTDAMLDRRQSVPYENYISQYWQYGYAGPYGFWQATRRAATMAMPKLRAYASPAHVGEMFAVRGYAELFLAETNCPGLPLHDIVNGKPVYSAPLTTDSIFERALADFDSAVAYATDSVRVLSFAGVGRARTLLGLGRFAEAGAAASGVLTDFTSEAFSGYAIAIPNDYGELPLGIANREGGSALDFVSAEDPRLPTDSVGIASDGVSVLYGTPLFPTEYAPIVLASGIEARLIQAEAALNAGDPSWRTILNDLRAARYGSALPTLPDPGTFDAQVDLLFRERAFWLFGTGHRLGDFRRLIRYYSRSADAVFPSGAYWRGGTYDAATSIPFPAITESANAPTATCTSR